VRPVFRRLQIYVYRVLSPTRQTRIDQITAAVYFGTSWEQGDPPGDASLLFYKTCNCLSLLNAKCSFVWWKTFVFAKTSAGQGGAVYYDASKHAQREGVRRPKLGSHNSDLTGHLTGDLTGDLAGDR
jgi:hypothetical protein